MQAEGGDHHGSGYWFRGLQTLCRKHDIQLIIDEVTQVGPAYRSGLRAGNTIVTVDDWLITLMDRPQVSC